MDRYDLQYEVVHPRPNLQSIKQLQNGPSRTLIVNIRDPVDRFVSAFNWRNAVLCQPSDNRIKKRSKGEKNWELPHKICKRRVKEEILLREKYQSNPSVLAEALCHDSVSRSHAEEDYHKIGHSTTLSEWLDFLIDPHLVEDMSDEGIQQLIVLPMEKRRGANKALFEKYIENLMLHLLQNRDGAYASKEMIQLGQEQGSKRRRNGLPEGSDQSTLHSSVEFYNSTQPLLSELGECCLARHLKDDYRLIQSMLGNASKRTNTTILLDPLQGSHPVLRKACSWGDEQQQRLCQGDLESMLMRRAKYLDESKGSCSAIVSAI